MLRLTKISSNLTGYSDQERSQNAENATHIKGRLPDKTAIPFNCVPFWELLLKERICSQREPLREVPYGMENHLTSLECYYSITHVRNCVVRATPMPIQINTTRIGVSIIYFRGHIYIVVISQL